MAFWIAAATLLVFVPSQLILEGNFTAKPRELMLVLLLAIVAFFPFLLQSTVPKHGPLSAMRRKKQLRCLS